MNISDKIFTNISIIEKSNEWKNCGEKIVFTNGCFDLLHLGHITYLMKAKELGTKLIVGVNSDESVRLLKPNRPIMDEITRMSIIASLYYVDAVVVFGESTPYNIIKSIRPNILVKGADYKIEDVVGAELVDDCILIDFLGNYSSTSIIEKIKKIV